MKRGMIAKLNEILGAYANEKPGKTVEVIQANNRILMRLRHDIKEQVGLLQKDDKITMDSLGIEEGKEITNLEWNKYILARKPILEEEATYTVDGKDVPFKLREVAREVFETLPLSSGHYDALYEIFGWKLPWEENTEKI